ncbi:MAG: 2-hydroxyacid dehydrogenase [Candidatus Marinimicrobia bacterium]|nr:2-hydroxyacid dehydrogenase [Candidatus Neomarinimicrobiota bacterium]MCF7829495.1 2-hydroxyacid dehydrogenase [Candidatus Neomarinimicrobiota bacterium]MCF7880107.1 2-hydroxyacid dehydrogenase [Candidatus Neomarinimicrobiota bacterium]
MKVAVFSTKEYDRRFFDELNEAHEHELTYFEPRLTRETASLANDFPAICAFVNDQLDAGVLLTLKRQGTELIALRSAGFNHVDLEAAEDLDLSVVRVPAYSPEAVAEHTLGLIMALNRKIHRAYARVREGNFSLDGLLGFNLHEQTVGIIGTGKIGIHVAKILNGFGCNILAYDPYPNDEIKSLGGKYVELSELFSESDIVTLHCPLMPATHHIINGDALSQMKQGVMLINTSRGSLIDTQAAIRSLKSGKIGSLGLDVYEEEADLFFEDLSEQVIKDDTFARLLTFPNVIITGHQGFFTKNALKNIAETTLDNISEYEESGDCENTVSLQQLKRSA